jgi:hypothetical protein
VNVYHEVLFVTVTAEKINDRLERRLAVLAGRLGGKLVARDGPRGTQKALRYLFPSKQHAARFSKALGKK